MKKILFVGLVAALFGMVSCTSESENTTTTTETVQTETPATPAEGVTEAPAAEVNEAAAPTVDIDGLLASYDKLVTTLSETAKQVKKKDLTAVAKFPQLLADAQNLQSQLEQAKNQMSENQLATFQKIVARMAQAVSDAK